MGWCYTTDPDKRWETCEAASATAGSDEHVALTIHNQYRCLHCDTPPLEWDDQLAKDAEKYAQTCPKGHAKDTNGAGENLAWHGHSHRVVENKASWESALRAWYDEEDNWNYRSSSGSGVTGHFTAMVWKGTTKLGCAMNANCNNMWDGFVNNVVVCRYLEHPNNGAYAANVKKLAKSSSCTASSKCNR